MDRVMNYEEPSSQFKSRCKSNSPPSNSSSRALMSTSDLVAVMESDEMDLTDSATTDFLFYCRVCLNINHLASQCIQIRDLKDFIHTRNRSFNYKRNQRDCYSSNSSSERGKHCQKLSPKGRPSQYCQCKAWNTSDQPGFCTEV